MLALTPPARRAAGRDGEPVPYGVCRGMGQERYRVDHPKVLRIRKPYARIDTAGTAGVEKIGMIFCMNLQLQLDGK